MDERQGPSPTYEEAALRLRDLLRCTTDWVWEVDADGRYRYVSERVTAILGYTVEEMLGRVCFELMPEDEADRLRGAFAASERAAACAEEVAPVELEHRALHRQGHEVYLLTRVVSVCHQGKVVGYRGVSRDLTAERFFRQILDINPDFVFVRDREGRFVVANRAVAEAYGTTVEDLIGKTDADFNPNAEEVAYIRRTDRQVMETLQELFIPEVPILRHRRWVQTVKRPIVGEDGVARYVLGVASDITARKRMEEAIRASLERRSRQVRTSTEIAQEIAQAPELRELFRRVVRLIRERFGYYHVQIFRYDAQAKVVRLVMGAGKAVEALLSAGHHWPLGRGPVGMAAETGQPVLIADVREAASWEPTPFLPETQGELAVPIKLRGEVLGVLDVQSDKPNALTEEDLLLLEGLCGQIAIAIETKQKEEELAREQRLLLALMEVVPEHICFKDTEGRFIRVSRAMAVWAGLEGPEEAVGKTDFDFFEAAYARRMRDQDRDVVRSGQPLLNVEMQERWKDGRTRWVAVSKLPMRDEQEKIVGVIGIAMDITERKRAEEVQERLLAELEARARQLRAALSEAKALYRISQAIGSATTMGEVLRQLVEAVGESVVAAAALHLFDRPWDAEVSPRYVEIAALWEGTEQEVEGMPHVGRRFDVSAHPLLPRLRANAPVVLSDEALPPPEEQSPACLCSLFPGHTLVSMPMRIGWRWMGYVELILRRGQEVAESQLPRWMALVGQAAAVVQNLRLLARTRRQVADLMMTQEAIAALMLTLTLDEAVAVLLPYVGRTRPVRRACVFVVEKGQLVQVGTFADEVYTPLRQPVQAALQRRMMAWMEQRRPVVVGPEDEAQAWLQDVLGDGETVHLLLPLKGRKGVLGMLTMTFGASEYLLAKHEVQLFQMLADQVALSFENIRLLAEARARAERERLVRDIISRIRRSVNREAVMRTTLAEVGQMLGASQSLIYLGVWEDARSSPPDRREAASRLPEEEVEET